MKKKVIFVDIDHTISDAAWRDGLISSSMTSHDWAVYHEAGKNDELLVGVGELIAALSASGFMIVGLTGRPERHRQGTQEWLVKNNVEFDDLIMRPHDDFRSAAVMKVDAAKGCFDSEEEFLERTIAVFDDRQDVIEAFAAVGITGFHVYAFNRVEKQ